MTQYDYAYRNSRPILVVNNKGGATLGNCYNASYFEVVSQHPLSMDDLRKLRDAGFLGYGQEFYAKQVIDGKKVSVPVTLDWQTRRDIERSGEDIVPCGMFDHAGKQVEGIATDPYSGKAYEPIAMPYYVYACESRVDSGD